jgi:DNA-binding transcriptional ArsR family regulator
VLQTDLSTIFAALADPTRRAILARLSESDAAVKALAEPFSLSGPAITKHLKVLEHAGLISRSREGQQRPCRLEPKALAPAADWIDQYRAMWEERLDRLGDYLKRTGPATAPAPERPERPPLESPVSPRTAAPQSRAALKRADLRKPNRSNTATTRRGERHGRKK